MLPSSSTSPHPPSQSKVSRKTVANLAKRGIESFTDIQYQAFEPVYEGRDMIARSRTGTGKTIAFGLPVIEKLAADAAAAE